MAGQSEERWGMRTGCGAGFARCEDRAEGERGMVSGRGRGKGMEGGMSEGLMRCR